MKKALLVLVAGILTMMSAQAQIKWDDYSQSYTDDVDEKPSTVGLILALRKGNDFLWSIRKTSKHFTALEKDSAFHRLRPNGILARTTFDTARAQFLLQGVNPQNAPLYQFRITEYPGNHVVVPWRGINQFTESPLIRDSGMPRMAYLGGYRTGLGKMLIVDVRKLDSDNIIVTSMVAWESIKPVITNIYTSENIDQFLKKLQFPWAPIKSRRTSHLPCSPYRLQTAILSLC